MQINTAEKFTLDNAAQVFIYEKEFYPLSNFSAFQLYWYGRHFMTSEHAYQWMKFRDAETSLAIESARSAHEAFKIAESNRHLVVPNWTNMRVTVMRNILWAKVEQHEYVKRKLLETGDREIIEESWRDDFWGWGPNRDGQNMLGRLWMEIRQEIARSVRSIC